MDSENILDLDVDVKINSKNFNFKEEIEIDPDALDVEWLYQPQLFIKYAEACLIAEIKYDKAKEYLEYVKADIDSDIRSNPFTYTNSDKKPTEGRINSLILTNEKYKEALQKFNAAKKQFKILNIALKGFEQRKYALENLVKLHGQSYFASPSSNCNSTPLNEAIANSLGVRVKNAQITAQEKIKNRMGKK